MPSEGGHPRKGRCQIELSIPPHRHVREGARIRTMLCQRPPLHIDAPFYRSTRLTSINLRGGGMLQKGASLGL